MSHGDVVAALTYLYPASEWSYDGDGTSLGPVTDDDGTVVSQGLVWHDDTVPVPTLDQLEQALAAVQLAQAVAGKQAEIKTALDGTDVWCVRNVEDGVSLTDDRKVYRQQLRSLYDQAAQAADVSAVAAITIPEPPAPPS